VVGAHYSKEPVDRTDGSGMEVNDGTD
jgi:hypothetical protein